jgi:A/G-specific adenine glycosylase
MDCSDAIDSTAGLKQLWSWAGDLADDKRPAQYHAALMELGQRVCKVGVPDCLGCPVASFCKTREPGLLPIKSRKIEMTRVGEHALWLRDGDGRILLEREAGARRTGLWKLPLRGVEEIGHLPMVASSEYGITRYRVSLKVYQGDHEDFVHEASDKVAWFSVDEVGHLPMAAPFRRMLTHLMAEF